MQLEASLLVLQHLGLPRGLQGRGTSAGCSWEGAHSNPGRCPPSSISCSTDNWPLLRIAADWTTHSLASAFFGFVAIASATPVGDRTRAPRFFGPWIVLLQGLLIGAEQWSPMLHLFDYVLTYT